MLRRVAPSPMEPHLLKAYDNSKTNATRKDIIDLLKPVEEDIYALTEEERIAADSVFMGALMKYGTK